METLRNDIKRAWRMFRANKLFTATAVAALTLGIGVNIAIFSVVNVVLLKPVVGIVAAFFLATFLAAVLYGVQARDVMLFVGVPAVLTATAFAAVWIAARRASRIDPLQALRYE